MASIEHDAPAPSDLMVDLLKDPDKALLTNRKPRFSWIVHPSPSGAQQTAYQILVASSPEKLQRGEADLWDSGVPDPAGWIPSTSSLHVLYEGKPLKANRSFFWKVRIWTGPDSVSPWSDPRRFRTGELTVERPLDCLDLTVSEVTPVTIANRDDGVTFIDFGKAAFGTVQLSIEVGEPAVIEIHLGEVLEQPGRIARNPGGSRRYQKIPLEVHPHKATFQLTIPPDPRNTRAFAIRMPDTLFEVYPFRYVEIHQLRKALAPGQIRQLAVHYPFNDTAARFASSNTVLNDVWDLCKYTIKATSFCGYYIDGDRERIPYEADAYINQLGHYCVDREYAMARRTHEHLIRFPTWPTEWILDSVLVAWNDYLYTGEASSLEAHYKNLKAKSLLALARDDGLISLEQMNEAILKSIHFDGPSRGLFPHGLRNIVDWPQSERDNFDDRPVNSVVNAFHYRAVSLMAEIAHAVGLSADAEAFRTRARLLQTSFAAAFFHPETGLVLDGLGSSHSSLHANMFALAFGLVPGGDTQDLLKHIRAKGMACSVYGAQFLLEALYAAGDAGTALALLTSTGERSWAHMVYDVGTTITLEAWDDRFKPNQDWNHAWGAAPANIIPRHLMGVQPLSPGFADILIKPQPGDLEWAELTTPTIRGPVFVRYEKTAGTDSQLQIETPGNTTTRVMLPIGKVDSRRVTIDGRPTSGVFQDGFLILDGLLAGKHLIRYPQ